jgi:hypothetical protein
METISINRQHARGIVWKLDWWTLGQGARCQGFNVAAEGGNMKLVDSNSKLLPKLNVSTRLTSGTITQAATFFCS